MSAYTVLAAAVDAMIEEKNSKFLSFLHPVASREEAMAWVDHYRKQYPDARHVCWAYVIGNTRQQQTQAFNDDGEPSGTAGKPMLYVLTEREVGNSLAVVVRYFGGIKLGAGGLVRAYSSAVSNAVNKAQLKHITPNVELEIQVGFARETKIRHLVNQYEGQVVSMDYGNAVTLQISMAQAQADVFTQQIINETAGNVQITRKESS
jgi:uncharacterized YigZ family protein